MKCAKTDDSFTYGEPTVYMNACTLRIAECVYQRTFPILCQGDVLCGQDKCNLSPDYFPYEPKSGKIDYSDYDFSSKGKSSGGKSAAAAGLELSKICSDEDWHCEIENAGSLSRIEHGICIHRDNGRKICECSVERTGETCAQLKSIGTNQTDANNKNSKNMFTLPNGQTGYLGICTGGNCQNCWMFGIFSMFLMMIAVAILVRKQPTIQLQAGNLPNLGGSSIDRTASISKGGWQRNRANSAIGKVNSSCNLLLESG